MAESVRQEKARLRNAALARRAELAATAQAVGRRIAVQVVGSDLWPRTSTLHSFVSSLPGEVDTHGLITAALRAGKEVVVPVLAGRGQPLRHARIGALDELDVSDFGLLQPRQPQFVEPAGIDLILVPGVLFDRRGFRIGHGGGYYDRFLAGQPSTRKVGLIYDEFVVDRIPTEAHDVPVDAVITPSGVYTVERTR